MAVDQPTTTTPNHKMTLRYINEAFLHSCVLTASHTVRTEAISTQESPTIGENPSWFFSGNPLMTPPGSILYAVTPNAIRCHWIPQSNTWRMLAQHKPIFFAITTAQPPENSPKLPTTGSFRSPVGRMLQWTRLYPRTGDKISTQPEITKYPPTIQDWTRKLKKVHPIGMKVGAELTSQQAVTTRVSVMSSLVAGSADAR